MKKYDGFDEAIIGYASVWQNRSRVTTIVYDGEKMCKVLADRDGMTFDEAREFVEYNIEGGYIGEDTPIVVWPSDALLEIVEDADWSDE